jgi:hypothetical protein
MSAERRRIDAETVSHRLRARSAHFAETVWARLREQLHRLASELGGCNLTTSDGNPFIITACANNRKMQLMILNDGIGEQIQAFRKFEGVGYVSGDSEIIAFSLHLDGDGAVYAKSTGSGLQLHFTSAADLADAILKDAFEALIQ